MTYRKGLGYCAGKCYGVIGAGKKNIPQRWVPQKSQQCWDPPRCRGVGFGVLLVGCWMTGIAFWGPAYGILPK